MQVLENLLGRSRYGSFVRSDRIKFYQQVKANAHVVFVMYSIFHSHFILLQPIFFLSILFFVICSLFKIIKEWNIWFTAIILHIRGEKKISCSSGFFGVSVCWIDKQYQFHDTFIFKVFCQENLVWHSEQKTKLIYHCIFFPSLFHPCNTPDWLDTYANGFCGGISIYDCILRQITVRLPLLVVKTDLRIIQKYL